MYGLVDMAQVALSILSISLDMSAIFDKGLQFFSVGTTVDVHCLIGSSWHDFRADLFTTLAISS